jgi:hypothetical protein
MYVLNRLLVQSPQTELVHYCLEDYLLIYQTPFNYLHQALHVRTFYSRHILQILQESMMQEGDNDAAYTASIRYKK